MANHKSSEKRARQAIRRQSRNTNIESSIKTFEKNLLKAIDTKSKEATDHLKMYTSRVMSAVTKGVIKKETASRKISRLSQKVAQFVK